jgi:hypothetical protein
VPHAQTANEALRRRLRNRAASSSLGVLKAKYRDEFVAYQDGHMEESGLSRRDAYSKARSDLTNAHRLEYETNLLAFEAQLQREHGYESQRHVGLAHRWKRVDTSDTIQENGT